MSRLGDLFYRLRALFHRDEVERDMDRELRFHLEMQIAENTRRGMSPAEARRQARLRLGGVEQVKEQCRDSRGTRLLEDLVQDVRFGARMLRRHPGFTTVAIGTLALGIGANTAVFSLVNGVLLQPLPYTSGERLVRVGQHAPQAGFQNMSFSVKEIEDYRQRSRSFDGLVEYHSMTFILLGHGEPEEVRTGVVSPGYFELFGVRALHGRSFVEADDDAAADPVLILSHGYWMRRFGGDPAVVGEHVEMNDRVHTIVGVLPPLPPYPRDNDVWMPPSACPFRSGASHVENRQMRMMQVFARLGDGASLDAAGADVANVAATLRQDHPDVYTERAGYDATVSSVREELVQEARPTFLLLLGIVSLVLLIACANVANLTLSRVIRREHELCVRASLGAGRGRLIRQMLTESGLLALLGGLLGLLISAGGLRFLVPFAARFTPRASEIGIDATVLGFTLGLSLITGILSGLIPALPARVDTATRLREGSDRATPTAARARLRNLLIVGQLAVSFMLLIGAGLLVRSLIKLHEVDPGFRSENVLTMRVNLNWSKYRDAEQRSGFLDPFLERVQSLPGVTNAALASNFPLNGGVPASHIHIEGRDADPEMLPVIDFRSATPAYFETMGIPLVQGRTFALSDGPEAAPVAIVNERMARHYWGNEDPTGRRLSFDGESWLTIVGVVANVRQYGLQAEAVDEFYVPYAQRAIGAARLVVRTSTPPLLLARAITEEVYRLDPEQPVTDVQTLEAVRAEAVASPRLTTILVGMFAGLALLISASGIGAVTAFSVSQRTHEIGVRMAMGARRSTVLAMILREGMLLAVAGLGLGITGALMLTRMIESLLFGIGPTDPVTFVSVALVLMGVAAISCLLPARRAAGIEPIVALRTN